MAGNGETEMTYYEQYPPLFNPLIELSVLKDKERMDGIISEWKFVESDYSDEWSYCACGVKIKLRCVLTNIHNKSTITVGSCCIKYFGMSKFIGAVKDNRINKSIIEYAKSENIINEWEYGFLSNIYRKRNLSQKQRAKRDIIAKNIFVCLKH